MLMIFCLLAGALLRRSGAASQKTQRALNGIALYFALPALTMRYLHQLLLMPDAAIATLMPRALFAACILLCILIGRHCGLSPATIAGLAIAGRLGNTGFPEIPMEHLHDKAAILFLAVPGRSGTYLVLSVFGMLAISLCETEKMTARSVAAKIFSSPPLMACCATPLLIDAVCPSLVEATPQHLGDLGTALAIIAAGFSIHMNELKERAMRLSIVLGYRLMRSPMLVISGCLLGCLPTGVLARHALLLRPAMGRKTGAAVIAWQRGQNPEARGLLLGIGIPLFLLAATLFIHCLSMAAPSAGVADAS